MCEFHVKKEINKAVLKAVTQVRRELEKTKTKRNKRGRPTTKEEKAQVRKNERIQAKIGALFEHRYLFVQKDLTAKDREKLREITRGLPELRKLREIVDEVYGLYDRRCCRATALNKLRKLRERMKRFKNLSTLLKKLESPTIDRSLLFLDDKQLPSTSNAVERGNRRFRKMQTASVWAGMEIAVEPKDWSRLIDGLSVVSYAKLLREISGRMNFSRYKRSRRGPKKARPPRDDSDGRHVSTARILAERNAEKSKFTKQ